MTTVAVGQAQIDHKQTVGNRYHLLGLLGTGGMGQVYRALDRLTGETGALKRVATDGIQAGSNAELRLALAHEFQALAGLRHPNIIGVRDWSQPTISVDFRFLGPDAGYLSRNFTAVTTVIVAIIPGVVVIVIPQARRNAPS